MQTLITEYLKFTEKNLKLFWSTAAQDSSVPLKQPIITTITITRDSENLI